MNTPATDLIALPKRLNAAQCKKVRDNLVFPDDHSDKDRTMVIEYMAENISSENHALIRELINNGVPSETIVSASNWYLFRPEYNSLLHNTLLIMSTLHRDGRLIDTNVLSSATYAITYPGSNDRGTAPLIITTHDVLKQAAAIVHFITTVKVTDSNVRKRQIGTGSYYAIANQHLEKLVRENPHDVDRIIALLKGRRIRTTKKGLAPVLLALHDERIKKVAAEANDFTDRMFDYYYERNPGTGNDITPLLEYLGTANAIKTGYL